MSSIAFTNGSKMEVSKIYEVKGNNKEAIDRAAANPKDNADYVYFNKNDQLYIAVGKGDLKDYNSRYA